MDPKALAAMNRLLHVMTPDQVAALADAVESVQLRTDGRQDRGGSTAEQGSVVLTIKGGRVRFLETRTSRDIGRLDSDAPVLSSGRV